MRCCHHGMVVPDTLSCIPTHVHRIRTTAVILCKTRDTTDTVLLFVHIYWYISLYNKIQFTGCQKPGHSKVAALSFPII